MAVGGGWGCPKGKDGRRGCGQWGGGVGMVLSLGFFYFCFIMVPREFRFTNVSYFGSSDSVPLLP